jgi:hypothetical protein
MSINLSKGLNINLTKEAPGLTEVTIGLGWKARVTDGVEFDLDALAFMLDENGKSPSVTRAFQPKPIVTSVRPGASLVKLIFKPLDKLIDISFSFKFKNYLLKSDQSQEIAIGFSK